MATAHIGLGQRRSVVGAVAGHGNRACPRPGSFWMTAILSSGVAFCHKVVHTGFRGQWSAAVRGLSPVTHDRFDAHGAQVGQNCSCMPGLMSVLQVDDTQNRDRFRRPPAVYRPIPATCSTSCVHLGAEDLPPLGCAHTARMASAAPLRISGSIGQIHDRSCGFGAVKGTTRRTGPAPELGARGSPKRSLASTTTLRFALWASRRARLASCGRIGISSRSAGAAIPA